MQKILFRGAASFGKSRVGCNSGQPLPRSRPIAYAARPARRFFPNAKKPPLFRMAFAFVMVLWRLPTLPGLTQVSSAVLGLTSLFGMGRGEHQANSHQQALWAMIESGNDRILRPPLRNGDCLCSHSLIESFIHSTFHVILEAEENKIKKI